MKKIFKYIFCILILILILFNFTGCYDAYGIEELAYVVAIGLDINESEELELTVQIATSGSSESSSGSSGSSSQSKETTVTTVKCNSINSGISLINNHITKRLNLSHCQVVLISEKIASSGLSQYIETLLNNVELRNDCSIVITKCKAKEYLENVNPTLETLTARYYQFGLKSGEYTGYTVDVTLFEFYSKMKDSHSQAYAVLGTILKQDDSEHPEKANANYFADSNPISDSDVIDNLGIAIFNDDKLVGELSGLDCICHSLVNNTVKECIISVPSPYTNSNSIDLRISQEKKTNCSVSMVNSGPLINVKLSLIGKGLSLDEITKYDTEDSIQAIEKQAEKYIENEISSYLYKTAKTYNSDICGFGKYAVSNYLTLDDWFKADWLQNYKNSFFNVEVKLNLKSGNLFNKS